VPGMVRPAHAARYQDMLDIVHSTPGRRFQERYRRRSVGDINAPYRVSRPSRYSADNRPVKGFLKAPRATLTETPAVAGSSEGCRGFGALTKRKRRGRGLRRATLGATPFL